MTPWEGRRAGGNKYVASFENDTQEWGMKMKTLTREERLGGLRNRYGRRGKEGKSRLLDEVCEEYGYSRKHAIKLMRDRLPKGRGGQRGVGSRYEGIQEVVERIWQRAEQPCAKRLVAALPLWLPYYPRHFGVLLPGQRRLLQEVSAATLDRLLAEQRQHALRGISGTQPGTLLRQQIPLQGQVWDEQRPGFLEADSVAHGGSSLAGDFIWSLVYTDLASTWTEGRAVWNKGWTGVLACTRDVEAALPFPLLGFDFDNGREWLNWHLIHYLQQRRHPVQVTRSRPYHKDDNAHVEQKNWMWPRQLLGYGRLAQAELVAPINALYKELWGPLHNAFLPSMKLKHKWREGSRWIRRHDAPQTAVQRLLRHPQVSPRRKRQLRDWQASLDPFALAEELERRLGMILRPGAKPRPVLVVEAFPPGLHHQRQPTGTDGVI
jgi:hypothetical protein